MDELAAYAARLTLRDEAGELSQVGFVPDLGRSHLELYARMLGDSRLEAENWQRQFYETYGTQEVAEFVSSFNRYTNSSHPLYAGRRLACQQCHRPDPPNSDKTPDRGFSSDKVAITVDGQWQVGPNPRSRHALGLDVGVAPFPPPAEHPERANTTVVEGPVILLPAGARDKEAAAHLLAWMVSPEIAAEAAYAHSLVPASRRAAQDPRFQQSPLWRVFVELVAHPNAQPALNPPLDPPGEG